MSDRPNILFVTLDQFRGDSLSCSGHPLVKTPNLDRVAAAGVRLTRHYSQAAPCGPGRAALYTGMYQMNNRVVANGTPLDDRFDNVARAAIRAGYTPTLFGYTDQGADPRTIDSDDPRMSTYEGTLPGFQTGLDLTGDHVAWLAHLAENGHALGSVRDAMTTENQRPVHLSVSSFLTDRLLAWIAEQSSPWFAHASYLRPHPPYMAAGEFATMYDPADCPKPFPVPDVRHQLHNALLADRATSAALRRTAVAEIRAQYYGMISEVDASLGRVIDELQRTGAWNNTVIVVTADHGEQLGDQGLLGKAGFFEASYHVLGLIRDPRRPNGHGTAVDHFTENVDILPTLCDLMGIAVPLQCDGLPLTAFLDGTEPPFWRDAASWEWDWRDSVIVADGKGFDRDTLPWPWGRRLEQQHLAVRRDATHAYVQFGDGSWQCFDLAGDPTWQTAEKDPSVVLALAQAMLVWRSTHTDRTLTGMLLQDGGIGRFPDPSPVTPLG